MRNTQRRLVAIPILLSLCMPVEAGKVNTSYYGGGDGFDGHRTASGEKFVASGLTAASRNFPRGAIIRACFHKCVNVRINDFGPAVATGRALDVSRGVAVAIGLVGPGHGYVDVTRIK